MLNLLFSTCSAPMNGGTFYEFSQFVWFIIFLIHCYKTHGKWPTIQIFVIGMIYGLILENGGPIQIPSLGFPGFFFENCYNIYLFQIFGYGISVSLVPLATQLGWPYVFYICILFWEKVCELFPKLKRNPFLGGLIISISGLLIDLNLDIYASRFNWWVWNPSLKPIWFGVPLTNYLAWFWAVYWFGVLWVLAYQDPKDTTIPVKTPKERTIFITKLAIFVLVLDLISFQVTFQLANLLGLIYV